MIIKDIYETKMLEFDQAIQQFPWEDLECYSSWLAQTYHFVSHSTRLLATASGRFPLGQDSLHYRFAKHIVEESKHEILAVSDLKNLRKQVADYSELAETSAFYQTQYYWIEHISPLSFFGYILMLEGGAVRKGDYIANRASKALGTNCTTFLKVHGSEDVGHLDEAFEQLEKLEPSQISIIQKNLNLSCDLYCSMLRKIQTSYSQTKAA